MILPLVVIIGSAAVVSAGMYLTLRGFRASEKRAAATMNGDAPVPSGNGHPPIARHDAATNEQLKHFFEGKSCAICHRPIPLVQRTGLKPGLMNPATHETQSWDQIPNENLSAALQTQVPLCSTCQVAESFRQRHPDLVVDRDRSTHDTQPHDRIVAGS